jgi:SAM-dependent methyltransferase
LEHDSFWFRARNRLIALTLCRYFPNISRFLELGCGTGFVLEGLREALPDLSLAGADFHAGGLAYANDRVPDAELFQFDARRIPFAAEFDVVGAFDVLEHIDADDAVLNQMSQAVKPRGGIIVTVPQHQWLWSPADEYAEHRRRYRRKELTEKITRAGFAVRRVTSFVSLLLPAMAAARVLERRAGRPYEPGREHESARRVGRQLERIADFERSLIMQGVNFPAGGSLLLVGERL